MWQHVKSTFRIGLTVALAAALTLTSATQSASAANPAASEKNWSVSVTHEPDGTKVEKGHLGQAQLESRVKDNKVVTTIRDGDKVEVVQVDLNSPYFTVTTNNETKRYDRREFVKTRQSFSVPGPLLERPAARGQRVMDGVAHDSLMHKPAELQTDAITTASAYPVVNPSTWFGTQYYGKYLGSRVDYNPYYVSGDLWEEYSYYAASYESYLLSSWTLFSVALGVIGIGWGTLMAVIGSVVAVIEGTRYVISQVNVDKNSYRRDWTRHVMVNQDRNNGAWYWAGRTVYSALVISVDGVTYENQSDTAHYDFYDVSALIQKGLDNYQAAYPR